VGIQILKGLQAVIFWGCCFVSLHQLHHHHHHHQQEQQQQHLFLSFFLFCKVKNPIWEAFFIPSRPFCMVSGVFKRDGLKTVVVVELLSCIVSSSFSFCTKE
jgi:hypothetical protein